MKATSITSVISHDNHFQLNQLKKNDLCTNLRKRLLTLRLHRKIANNLNRLVLAREAYTNHTYFYRSHEF